MRMWLVDPTIMCKNHLLGEHVELHMLVGTIKKNKSIRGYVDQGICETGFILNRHEELVNEIKRRNYNHKSPLNYQDTLNLGKVNREASLKELLRRCKDCRRNYGLRNKESTA